VVVEYCAIEIEMGSERVVCILKMAGFFSLVGSARRGRLLCGGFRLAWNSSLVGPFCLLLGDDKLGSSRIDGLNRQVPNKEDVYLV
jgi:hypothetical protein